MPSLIYRLRQRIVVGVIWIALASSPSVLCQTSTIPSPVKPADRQLNMLVLGDSVLWGEGLKTEHKSWYQIKTWLEANTGRVVIERIEAHSGAVIEAKDATENKTAEDGEVNVALPSISSQVDQAFRHYKDGSKVDLVLVNGSANDIGSQNLLNAAITTDEIRRLTETKCGVPIERLLRKITSSFANAHVIMTGYYSFFSEKTRNDFFLKAMARRFFKDNPGAPKMGSKVTLERLIANSKEWYEASNQSIAAAVAKVNAELGSRDSGPRIDFAQLHFLPAHSFKAPETYLWGFNPSPFKRLLVFLSFGKVQLETNDERRKQRNRGCDEFYRRQAGETPDEKKDREKNRLTCRYSALGHPNRKGAVFYAQEITSQLKTAIGEVGWLRELSTPHTGASRFE
jgi:lysophospholipase L1-like esterase